MENPFALFQSWLDEAKAHPDIKEPTAMTLATSTPDGVPSARIVLMRRFDEGGCVFYTNLTSRKSEDIKQNSHVALCFYWPQLNKQVRIEGQAKPVADEEANAYFAQRPRGSQIGAWASEQSKPLSSKQALEEKIERLTSTYEDVDIPRPKHWGGWRVYPHSFEFWIEGEYRVHDRWLIEKGTTATWQKTLLNP